VGGTGGSTTTGGTGVTSTGGNLSYDGAVGTGGSTRTGGNFATGGTVATGGTHASGGRAATGGSIATGGTVAAGGTIATGGTTATGGSVATGGTTVIGAGGTSGSGGAVAAGGQTSSGGASGQGGNVGSGGFPSAGGATGQDASADQATDAPTDAPDDVPGTVDADQTAEVATPMDAPLEEVSPAGGDVAPIQNDTDVADDSPLVDVAGPDSAVDLASTDEPANADGPGLPIGNSRVLLLHTEELSWNTTAGEVVDDSGLGNNGTAVGTATTTSDGRFGRAGLFDGAGSVAVSDAPSIHPTTALTMAAWIFPTGLGVGAQGIIAKRTSYNVDSAYSMYIDTDRKLWVDIDSFNDRFSSSTVLANGSWYHVAVVFDGGLSAEQRVRVYVNGVLDITSSESSSTIPAYTSALSVGLLPGGGDGFVGTIDEVSVWTRALEPAEIAALAAATGPL
jgi:hypothetical protein